MRWDGQLVGVHNFLGRARTNKPAGVAWPAPATRSKGDELRYELHSDAPSRAKAEPEPVLHALGLITPSAPTAKE